MRLDDSQVMPETPQEFSVLGLPIHLLEDYPSWLVSCVYQNRGAHVVTLNAEMTMQAEQNVALANAIRQADLVIPDGAGIVLYFRLQGRKIKRCPGIELAEAMLHNSVPKCKQREPWPVFFYGGSPGVAQQAAEYWQNRLPEMAIAGTQHGYLSPEAESELLETLKTLQPRIIFVGLGVPRQELWIAQHRQICPQSIWIGVGGSLDIWAGVKSRAPVWLRDNNLEWFYRLYQEPHRWRRMLALPQFAWRAFIRS